MRVIIIMMLFIANIAMAQNGEYEWIQFGHNNQLFARATTTSQKCPLVVVDDERFRMHLRAEQEDIELKQKVRVCEYNVTTANKVSIRNKKLKLLPKQVDRFIVIGDTGCEASFFEEKHNKQKCSDPKAWPFEAVANKIASLSPDFVIHLGDYAYRNKYHTEEDAAKNQQMQWYFFKNEFFKPAKKLLNKAPMIFIRGNHDACNLMGKAWFLFLDPQDYQEQCKQYTSAYQIQINDLNFVAFDSSAAHPGKNYNEAQLKEYKNEFANVEKNLTKNTWLLIHHPVLGLHRLSADEGFGTKLNALVVRDAFGAEHTKKIPMAMSGHFHLAAEVTRESDNFKQFIFGNGGTLLHKAKHNSYQYDAEGEKGIVKTNAFAYTQFDRIGNNLWKATSFAMDGSILFTSELSSN